ncbi:hypothetical protein [Streptomyces sp. NPDC006997]|uniref:hypothetical protein n=1 Tax=Streptomyces sp. NPDC006997 TaxID=3155356 RepID=UPI0033D76672
MKRDLKDIWERERRQVRQLRDGLGKPVDRQIVEAVTILRVLGFTTTGSCGGHADRLLAPYVGFRSATNAEDRQYIEQAPDQAARRRRKNQTIRHNAAELGRLVPLLGRFYDGSAVPYKQRLICQGFGVIGYRLTTQDADLVTVVSKDERRELVKRQRREFDAFTKFLEAEFFAALDDAPSRAA